MPPLSVPTGSALPPAQRVASTNPGVFRILSKLSRSSLLSLVLDWLDDRNQAVSAPYLAGEDDEEDASELYPPSHSLDELREYYNDLQSRKGTKRDLVDRIVEGDWRNGLSLYQLAMADMQYLYDHPLSQKWTALKVIQLHDSDSPSSKSAALSLIPRFHPPTFLQNLQRSILPDIKAHYNLDRSPTQPLLLLRIFMIDSPYNTSLSLASPNVLDAAKTIYIAFPDASPHIYVSLTTALPSATTSTAPPTNAATSADVKSLRKIVLDCIPKAFSRPRARYALQPTNLSARSLAAMVAMRGGGRTNAAGGAWGVYAEAGKKDARLDTPLNTALPLVPKDDGDKENQVQGQARGKAAGLGMKRKREDAAAPEAGHRRVLAKSRFGDAGRVEDGKDIERLDVRIEDPFPAIEGEGAQEDWRPDIRVTFHGSHVFAGIRRLVERGIIDGRRMPGWMTGEEGVSVGVVKEGRIIGFKGSGI
jgi:central kinetochore subunit Mis15/CHL4